MNLSMVTAITCVMTTCYRWTAVHSSTLWWHRKVTYGNAAVERVRAFADLAQLSDAEFFASLAEGLVAIHENASRLAHGMETLKAAGNARAANVLETLANEEAGKYLILLDAVRCPRDSSVQASAPVEGW